jgi:hypothetical protein
VEVVAMSWEEKYQAELRRQRALSAARNAAERAWNERHARLQQTVHDMTYRIDREVVARFLRVASCREGLAVASVEQALPERSPDSGQATTGTLLWRIDDYQVSLEPASPSGFAGWRDHLLIYADGSWEYVAMARTDGSRVHVRIGRGTSGWLEHGVRPRGGDSFTELGDPLEIGKIVPLTDFIFSRAERAVLGFMVINGIAPQRSSSPPEAPRLGLRRV